MNIEIFALCDFAVDKNGQLTIVSTFDTLFPPALPYKHPLCFIAVRLRTSHEEIGRHSFKIILKSPDGDVVTRIEGYLDIEKSDEHSGTANAAIGQQNLPFDVLGRYSLTLSVDDTELATLPLLVRKHPSLE